MYSTWGRHLFHLANELPWKMPTLLQPYLTARSVFLSCFPFDLSSPPWFSELSFGTAEQDGLKSFHLLFSVIVHSLILLEGQGYDIYAPYNIIILAVGLGNSSNNLTIAHFPY